MGRRRATPTDIASLARVHTETAIKTLVGIASSTKASDSARVAAANSLLDRGYGKALSKTESTSTSHQTNLHVVRAVDLMESPDMQALMERLRSDEQRLARHSAKQGAKSVTQLH